MVKAKKKYGQNFLKDKTIITKIIESMPRNKNQIIEIGPGLGDLSKELLKCKNVIAYEVDKDLYNILKSNFNSQNFDLILADVLEIWEKGSLYNSDFDLVANLPYYIATNIILKALEDKNCKNILVMVQKEVALKLCANTNEKEFSALSVIVQSLTNKAEILFDVKPESFEPQPKVTSSVILLEKNGNIITKEFKDFLKVCFSQPRKKLLKNLSSKFDKEILYAIFDKYNILDKRPHQVETFLYHQIYKEVIENGRETKPKQHK